MSIHSSVQVIPVPKGWKRELEALQARIDVKFNNTTHLMCALTHHGAFSHNQVAGDVPAHRLSNRSLEFLGDSVLGMAVASYLFQAQPMHQEGQLTQSKWALVNNQTLSKICVHDLQIDKLILVAPDYSLARQSSKSIYVKGRATIQSGAVESLIAAVYLDQVSLVAGCCCCVPKAITKSRSYACVGPGSRVGVCEHQDPAARSQVRDARDRVGAHRCTTEPAAGERLRSPGVQVRHPSNTCAVITW